MDKKPGGRGRGRLSSISKNGETKFGEVPVNAANGTMVRILASTSVPRDDTGEEASKIMVQSAKIHEVADVKSINVEASESDEDSVSEVPKSLVEAAEDFRSDLILLDTPVESYFFCCICGCPAGRKCFICECMAHPVCKFCVRDLKIVGCPYPIYEGDESRICCSVLIRQKSKFCKFMYKKTIVGCLYRSKGCEYENRWTKVKKHQRRCKFSGKTPQNSAEERGELCELNYSEYDSTTSESTDEQETEFTRGYESTSSESSSEHESSNRGYSSSKEESTSSESSSYYK